MCVCVCVCVCVYSKGSLFGVIMVSLVYPKTIRLPVYINVNIISNRKYIIAFTDFYYSNAY